MSSKLIYSLKMSYSAAVHLVPSSSGHYLDGKYKIEIELYISLEDVHVVSHNLDSILFGDAV
jgi:hypothetical protein